MVIILLIYLTIAGCCFTYSLHIYHKLKFTVPTDKEITLLQASGTILSLCTMIFFIISLYWVEHKF